MSHPDSFKCVTLLEKGNILERKGWQQIGTLHFGEKFYKKLMNKINTYLVKITHDAKMFSKLPGDPIMAKWKKSKISYTKDILPQNRIVFKPNRAAAEMEYRYQLLRLQDS